MKHLIVPPSFPLNALEPYFDAATMELHVHKHHQAYADKLNLAVADRPELTDFSLNQLLVHPFTQNPADIHLKNMAGGVYNHNLFWSLLTPDLDQPIPSQLQSALTTAFSSVDGFKERFTASATSLFGSGWTWLVKRDAALEIINLPNQDTPLPQQAQPLLALDLWEHAYYLKYQNRRPEYIAAFWHVVNWSAVNQLFQAK